MLNDAGTYTTLPVTELERARRFYSETLGMREVMVTDGGIMFASGATQFFVYPSSFRASGHTQMSGTVPDIRKEGRRASWPRTEVRGIRRPGGKDGRRHLSSGSECVDGILQGPGWQPARPDPDRRANAGGELI